MRDNTLREKLKREKKTTLHKLEKTKNINWRDKRMKKTI